MPGTNSQRVPPGQELVTDFPVLHAGRVAHIDPANWSMTLSGSVDTPRIIDWNALMAMPAVEQTSDIHCVTTLVQARHSLERRAHAPTCSRARGGLGGQHVLVHAERNWTTNLPSGGVAA